MKIIAITFALLYCNLAICSVINIPADYSSIQEGINSATPGDTVLVSPGTYMESVNLSIDSITLASWYLITGDTSYISQTIIDGEGQTVFTISFPASEAVSIVGFTIQNGDDGISANTRFTLLNNQIIHCNDGVDYESGSGGLCKNNIFRNNSDDGIDLDGAVDILIEDNITANNGDDGIEIRLHNYSGDNLNYIIRRNQIYGNDEDGIQLIDYPDTSSRVFLIEHNIIYNNVMAGIGCMSNGNTVENYEGAAIKETIFLFNNTIDHNNYGVTGGYNLVAVNNIFSNTNHIAIKNVNGNSEVAFCCLYGNTTDILNSSIDSATFVFSDPLFNHDYELSEGSQCIDAGTPFFLWQSIPVLNLSANDYFGLNPDIGAIESKLINKAYFQENKTDFIIFPNPNHGLFNLNIHDNSEYSTLEIINPNGQRIISTKLNNKISQIDLSDYSKGLYIIKLNGDKFAIFKRIIII